MDADTIWDASELSVATIAPTMRQLRLAVVVVAVVIIVTGIMIPFGATQLPRTDGFIPAIESVIVVSDLFTAALLLAQANIIGSRRVLLLASGYLFSAPIVVAHALTFPGAFSESGLLGSGLQTTPWLFIFWHLGFPVSVIGYVYLKDRKRALTLTMAYWSAMFVVALALVLTWFVTAHHDTLPHLFADRRNLTPLGNDVTRIDLIISVVALIALLRNQKSILDLWLTVAVVALVAELSVTSFVIVSRFSLGFYVSRLLSVTVSVVVLLVLLAETTGLYVRLAKAIVQLRRERRSRMMSVEAATASIAHEVRQPITAIASRAGAGLRWLKRTPPNLEEVRASLESIVVANRRTDEIISSVRGIYKKTPNERTMIDINSAIRQVLGLVEDDLQVAQISVATDYQEDLPLINANGIQLQEVILNLVKNAMDAMASVSPSKRRLRLQTKLGEGPSGVSLLIGDSGTGIIAEDRDHIFDPFFTTKPTGTGLGLSLCRIMIEDHGGYLRLIKTDSCGSIFEVTMPSAPTSDGPKRSQ
jgi:signal transduction histidine kinase